MKTAIMDTSFKLRLKNLVKLCYIILACRPLCQLCVGSQVHSEVIKAMWSGELSDQYTAAVYIYYNTGIRIVDINMRLNLIVRLNSFLEYH